MVDGAGGAGKQGCGTEAVNGASGGVPGPEARRGEGRRLRVDSDSIRLALSVSEACEALGVSWDFWSEHIAPEVRVVRRGRRKLIAVTELEHWLERNGEASGAITSASARTNRRRRRADESASPARGAQRRDGAARQAALFAPSVEDRSHTTGAS